MKSLINLFCAFIIALLPFTVSAQTDTVDLQAIMPQPGNMDTVVGNQTFQYTLFIKNNGPDTLLAPYSLHIFRSTGGYQFDSIILNDQTINPGDSLEFYSESGVTITGNVDTFSLPLCFSFKMYNSNDVDPDSLNNSTCDTVEFINTNTGIATVGTEPAVVDIYPDPANASVAVSFASTGDADVNIRIIDLSGREALQRNFGKLPVGKNKVMLDISALQNGMYFVEIQQNGARSTSKLIVQH